MCGIHVVISRTTSQTDCDVISPDLRRCLCNRGPDHFGQARRSHGSGEDGGEAQIVFSSTVLSLRGDHIAQQPLEDGASGSVFCWNGEAWSIGGVDVKGNDAEDVFQQLTAASRSAADGDSTCVQKASLAILRSIEGPFAFVYYSRGAGKIYFGRDRLGRRSLLIRKNKADGSFVLSSVAESADSGWEEVEADGIYVLDLSSATLSLAGMVSRLDWVDPETTTQDTVSGIGPFNMTVPTAAVPPLTSASTSVQQLKHVLHESLHKRLLNVPQPPRSADVDDNEDTRIAVLFSGGLDCTVLARMAHDILPPGQGIDLLNVAFENPRVAAVRAKEKAANGDRGTDDIYEACPDRITGRKSFAELVGACPGRVWRFVAINVPYSENVAHRRQIISLMHPHNTEMDLSIGSALYFSSRGIGSMQTSPSADVREYTTSARVLLSGLGADELFGGYSRHSVAFAPREPSRKWKGDPEANGISERPAITGYAALAAELKLDVERLGRRNLGRDDRVMANWGREVRFPYLDEGLVRWAVGLPAWEKCDFGSPVVEGQDMVEPGKRILRLLAVQLGMDGVAREKKRAIQFGARTAKMESGRVKGTTTISLEEG